MRETFGSSTSLSSATLLFGLWRLSSGSPHIVCAAALVVLVAQVHPHLRLVLLLLLFQLAALLSFARNMFFSFSLSLSPQVCLQLRLEIHSSGNIIGHGHACYCL